MHTHTVEVDDEVFQFVKAQAEPLVDDFNSALKRLLDLSKEAVIPDFTRRRAVPSLPSGTPMALRQILEVISLVRGDSYSRSDATRFVAKQHGVFPQTVIDKYGRQLGLTAGQFDRLLEREDMSELERILVSRFPSHTDSIEAVLR